MMEIQTVQTTRRTKLWFVGAALLMILVGIGYWIFRSTARPGTSSSRTVTMARSSASADTEIVSLSDELIRRAGIGTVRVEVRDFTSELPAIGVLKIPEPAERVISARAGGRIEHMFVSATGSYVHKGEPLFEFYSPDILNAEREFITANSINAMPAGMIHTPGMDHSHSNEG